MSHDADDDTSNVSSNPSLSDVISERLKGLSRRGVLRGGFGLGMWSLLGGSSLPSFGCTDSEDPIDPPTPGPPPDPNQRLTALGFTAVAKSLDDAIKLPPGYRYSVLCALGDPIAAGVSPYANDGTDNAASYPQRAGDHHDGIHYFGLSASGGYDGGSSNRGLLCTNHESLTPLFLHPSGQTVVNGTRTVAAEVDRELYLHGVSVLEVNRSAAGAWTYKQDSSFNRRIHTLTEVELSGPLRGHASMQTKYSKDGLRTRGTVNNCANGYTPWGTYLTCEENWAGYFRRITATDNPNRSAKEVTALTRYGVGGNGNHLWATVTPDTADDRYGRWNGMVLGATAGDDYRNAANTYGWIVEIDPFNPGSTPRKRTAMGRFGHEGAWIANPVAGKPLVIYSGDDARGEYVYKYVSRAVWDPADAERTDRTAVGDKYLDDGALYVAQFGQDGTGKWLELAFGQNNITASYAPYSFADQKDVQLHARLAGDAAGATKMDRPEWGAVDPVTGAVYLTLTNNNATLRTLASLDAANPRHYNDPKKVGEVTTAQYGNPNGHIVRWQEPSPEALTFTWDIYLFGAAADASGDVNLSGLDADSDFSSPDGLWFSPRTKILWIQTDDGAFTDVSNCMMLAALPGKVGDGGPRMVGNIDALGASKMVTTYVGAKPGPKLRRFLVGPRQCEITGITESPDGTALFVNIQHPGEDTALANLATPSSTWPSTVAGTRPRSATIVITRTDGGIIGTL